MWSINGVALDSQAKDWWVEGSTRTVPGLVMDLPSVQVPGSDGVVTLPGSAAAIVWPITMRVPRSRVSELMALFRAGGVISPTADSSREAEFTFVSASVARENTVAGIVWLTFTIRLNGAAWRATSVSTSSAASISSASVDVAGFMSGMSAPVQDAIVRVKGGVGGLVVADHGGSWFSLDGVLDSDEWLRFEAATGRAFITTSDAWIGGAEVSDRIDYGGPRTVFELTPYWSSDPGVRSGKVTVSTVSRSGSPTVEVRGRAAFLT